MLEDPSADIYLYKSSSTLRLLTLPFLNFQSAWSIIEAGYRHLISGTVTEQKYGRSCMFLSEKFIFP